MTSKIKVVIVGNCQARPLAKILESLNSQIDVKKIAIVHLLKSDQFSEYSQAFEQADLIVSQLVSDTYPCDFVRTNFLKENYGEKVISIVNLYFTGYTPDWLYLRIPGKGPLKGPMGDYHNRSVIEAWCEGESEDVACYRLSDPDYNRRYLTEIDKSIAELSQREQTVDVPIADVIVARYMEERLFFTFNHPSMALIREYGKRILEKAKIGRKRSFWMQKDREVLDQFIPLTNPATGLPVGGGEKHKGVEFYFDRENFIKIGPKKYYDNYELIEGFFSIYQEYGDDLELKKKFIFDK